MISAPATDISHSTKIVRSIIQLGICNYAPDYFASAGICLVENCHASTAVNCSFLSFHNVKVMSTTRSDGDCRPILARQSPTIHCSWNNLGTFTKSIGWFLCI